MAATPQFTQAARIGSVFINVGNAQRDGGGNMSTVLTAAASGTRVDKILVKATASTTSGFVRLFISVSGVNYLFMEISVPTISASSTVPAFETVVDLQGGIVLPSGTSLKASTEKAEGFNVIGLGGDF